MTRLESELKFTVACKSISKKEKKLRQLIYGFCYFERSCHSIKIYANLKKNNKFNPLFSLNEINKRLIVEIKDDNL